jgi:hypothetical protein
VHRLRVCSRDRRQLTHSLLLCTSHQVAGLWVILAISVGVSLLLLAFNLWWIRMTSRRHVASRPGDVEHQVLSQGPLPAPSGLLVGEQETAGGGAGAE